MAQPGQSTALIDCAKAIVNDRIDALERDMGAAIARGVPWEKAMAGALHWAFLVGVFAGKGPE